MKISSEYVTNGHPDRLADAIAANLINRIQKKDGFNSHAAIEIFLVGDTCVFGGEAKTSLDLTDEYLREVLEESFNDCGYRDAKRNWFTLDQVKLAKDTKIINKIHAQSSDIAQATTDKENDSGFNDQGIFFGAYDSATPTGQGYAKYLAQSFGDYLFNLSFAVDSLGSDIKTVFVLSVESDMYTPKSIDHVTVAIPTSEDFLKTEDLEERIKLEYKNWIKVLEKENGHIDKFIKDSNPTFTINGTGRYVNHGYAHDTSLTGRKIAVNNISAGPLYMQCQCGGGSYIKPFHASDFLLPMVGNWFAKAIVDLKISSFAGVALSCSIGSHKADNITIYGDDSFNSNDVLVNAVTNALKNIPIAPHDLAVAWGFDDGDYPTFDFRDIALNNFVDEESCPWYHTTDIKDAIQKELYENKILYLTKE